MSDAVYPLQDNQLAAANPEDSVWLSASAGTGKTQVLSARVLRLLLQPHLDPSQILCLTFTKAGAAEMATRINSVLARWVRLSETQLGKELGHLGAPNDVETRDRARTLFASVLDCPGGGLRIDTIHAFSQWLLANFPNEAEMQPGMRPMEDRERALLMRETLAAMLVEAEQTSDHATLEIVSEFTRTKGQDALQKWLMRCANLHQLWKGPRGWQPPMAPQVKQLLGIPSDADEAWVHEVLSADVFPDHHLQAMLPLMDGWSAKTGKETAEFIRAWLPLDLAGRVECFGQFYLTVLTAKGLPRQMKIPSQEDPSLPARQEEIAQALACFAERKSLLELSQFLAPALELGRAFYLRWDAAKAREGLLDFDDLIERAASLLKKKEAADWIRFKLDRRFDHILVDEAQDTNKPQWDIIDALIDDFFSGQGAAGDKVRTIFAVGDYKQAIFGFQGTSPENFRKAKERVKAAMHSAVQNAAEARLNSRQRALQDLDLGQSFRTSVPILEFVDRAVDTIGPENIGLTDPYHSHKGENRPGLVTLWNPVHDERENDEAAEGRGDDKGEEGWLAKHDRKMAERIAKQVKRWTDGTEPFALQKGQHRNARPGDIMVLVRSRKDLAGLIVARLHAKGVPVAGVDRLRMGDPLAVKDLMATLRFAAQPLDDLQLANLLSSPLMGWSQDELLQYIPREPKQRLWDHLRKHDAPFVQATVAKLRELLALADFETPQSLLEWMLVGPWQSRAKLVARLGADANDPINELVNSAFAYESGHTPSLAGFIQWFDAGDGVLKRDPDDAPDLVRVLTVHGSKGLQAPIVILADATSKPGQVRDLELEEEIPGANEADSRSVPLPGINAEQRKGRLEEAYDQAKARDLQEHWRLLYVAMTRAEEALFIGGSLGPKTQQPHEDSWYARLSPLMDVDALDDDIWDARREYGGRAEPITTDEAEEIGVRDTLPEWLRTPIGPEPRPPRPLAPSSAGDDTGSDPPLPADMVQSAARRGVLIHSLLERLPDVKADEREKQALTWLERQAGDLSENERSEIAGQAIKVLDNADFADVFAPGSLAEVPLAATVGGQVIAGTVDRLLITETTVTVVDFKTARRPPSSLEEIPDSIVKQIAAYVAALEVIYPEHEIRAAVLYTQTPEIFVIPHKLIRLHKNAFATEDESYPPADVE
ncbi:double-strand break repair helicase AddA [Altererythrobacter sp.]|uniref:double-strand break repair helicase AddA n=1 Tax=Altererythrobacter sp. TaxID=1872480 RepID=UPI001B2F6776|nr:double-strand break repair helicase AddA [Altererythrobacter sp.]MBO6609237.1 double-strand break repair helicase AddA [Altererythrobacter sp.]MBO6641237.1 double-strand break repair helicase AddA [Altererythrobacter sp.]MBO6708065.1 double-strand break repair helicase AddA [Altererythrobacter sp.]